MKRKIIMLLSALVILCMGYFYIKTEEGGISDGNIQRKKVEYSYDELAGISIAPFYEWIHGESDKKIH